MVAVPLVDKLLATPLHQPDMVVEMDMAAVAERPVVGVRQLDPRQVRGLPVADEGIGGIHGL